MPWLVNFRRKANRGIKHRGERAEPGERTEMRARGLTWWEPVPSRLEGRVGLDVELLRERLA